MLKSLGVERFTPFHHFIRPLPRFYRSRTVRNARKLHDDTVTHPEIQANGTSEPIRVNWLQTDETDENGVHYEVCTPPWCIVQQ